MNRPDELIKELRDFDACAYGDELSSRQCHEIVDYIDSLEKALGKAIELLDRNMLCENCPFPHDTKRCTAKGCREYLRECLLEGNKDGCRKTV